MNKLSKRPSLAYAEDRFAGRGQRDHARPTEADLDPFAVVTLQVMQPDRPDGLRAGEPHSWPSEANEN